MENKNDRIDPIILTPDTSEQPPVDRLRPDPQQASEVREALYKRAAEIARGIAVQSRENLDILSATQIRHLYDELRVHQIELEMQNHELRRLHDELDLSRSRYFDLYDLAPVGYATLSDTGVVLEANRTLGVMLDRPRSLVLQQSLTSFIHPADQDIYYFLSKQLFATHTPQTGELRMARADGTLVWVRLDATVVKDSDGATVCRLTAGDVTERKRLEADQIRLERQLQQAGKLESLGLLAGGIAHDFNNLMGGIFGYVELAMDEYGEGNAAHYLRQALATMERARSLTAQLLTFAKGGNPTLKNTPMFPFVHDRVRFALGGSTVAVRFSVQEGLWNCIIDKGQTGIVIDNIITNARQAMPHGGILEITAGNVFLKKSDHAVLPDGKYVRLSFKDAGPGIPREILPRIFDPFFTTKPTARGLGLATCYSIVTRHGGAVEVESEPGRGSTFHVYLPAFTGGADEPVAPVAAHHSGGGTIIVMDDEEGIREISRKMLEGMGYTVLCAQSGREALDVVAVERKSGRVITAMLFDLTVPDGMGGVETLAELRKEDAETPVFVASGYADDPVMQDPVAYGFTASICKPYRRNDLAAMLQKNSGKKS